MNTFVAIGPPGLPQRETMYPAIGAIPWTTSRRIPLQLRQRTRRGVTSSAQRTRAAALARQQAAKAKAAARAAARKAASPRSYQSYFRRRGRAAPAGMRQRIERANIEIARRKAATAARRKAEAERRARVAVHPRRPAPNAGIRAWEAYYKATGTTLSASQRRTLERREKTAFARATGTVYFIPKSFTQQSQVGVRRGVTWMFPVAYGKDSMPYWDLWFDKRASAVEIGRKVAEDYKREIMRRVAVMTKYRAEREAWQDAGRPGPAPRVEARAGIDSPITPPKMYVPAPERRVYRPPVRWVRKRRRRAYRPSARRR